MKIPVSYILILFLIIGCNRHKPDSRLIEIEQLSDSNPALALSQLDSIDKENLDEYNRHYYDFLKIKESDKSYIYHTSDSLYLSVLNYFKDRESDSLYPEVLYYGGRVYSDLGDYPTALDYFHQTEDALQDSQKNTQLESRILSQTGRLLNTLRLYEEAIPYIEKAIEINKQNGDYKNVVYNLQLLGKIASDINDYQRAEKYLKQTYNYTDSISPSILAISDVYQAEIYYECEKLDSALLYIKRAERNLNQISKNSESINAARIYLKINNLDSARILVDDIIYGDDYSQKSLAFYLVLSTDLRNLYPKDTLFNFISEYHKLLEEEYNQSSHQLALDRQNIYNYKIHERQRKVAEKFNNTLICCITVLLLILMLVVIIILILGYRKKVQFIKLTRAHAEINRLQSEIEKHILNKSKKPYTEENDIGVMVDKKTLSYSAIKDTALNSGKTVVLSKKLLNELTQLCKDNPNPKISNYILSSPIYKKIKENIKQEIPLKDEDWDEIKNIVKKDSANFFKTINIIAGRELSRIEVEIALLSRLGIRPKDIAILTGRAKSSISERRESLKKALFGDIDTSLKIDKLILSIP